MTKLIDELQKDIKVLLDRLRNRYAIKLKQAKVFADLVTECTNISNVKLEDEAEEINLIKKTLNELQALALKIKQNYGIFFDTFGSDILVSDYWWDFVVGINKILYNDKYSLGNLRIYSLEKNEGNLQEKIKKLEKDQDPNILKKCKELEENIQDLGKTLKMEQEKNKLNIESYEKVLKQLKEDMLKLKKELEQTKIDNQAKNELIEKLSLQLRQKEGEIQLLKQENEQLKNQVLEGNRQKIDPKKLTPRKSNFGYFF